MRHCIRLLVTAWLPLALLAAACAAPDPPPAPTTTTAPPVGAFGGVQEITEAYAQKQIVETTARDWATAMMWTLVGPNKSTSYARLISVDSRTWDSDQRVVAHWLVNERAGVQRHLEMSFVFRGPVYDTGNGEVKIGKCHQLPDAGTKTTGEHTTIQNGTSNPIQHHLEHTTEETKAQSVTLTETIKLTSGESLEAGAGGEKITLALSEEFGYDKAETEDSSSSKSRTISDDIEIDPRQGPETPTIVETIYSLDDSATDCTIHIGAPLDWTDIRFDLGSYVAAQPVSWQRTHDLDPNAYGNLSLLLSGDILKDADTTHAYMTFKTSDDVYRLFTGFNVGCARCRYLPAQFPSTAKAALARMSDSDSRFLSYDGLRHDTSSDSASYTALDVTDLDHECVARKVTTAGLPLEGLLDDC